MADDDPLSAALAEIREREQAATPGPWTIETDSCDCGDGYGCPHGTFPYAIVTSRPHTERHPGEPPRDYDFRHSEVCELPLEDVEFITAARDYVPRLLAALDAVLALHAPTATTRYTEACPAHYASMLGRLECPACRKVKRTGCQTCRDEHGNPARPEDCKERAAALAALRGEVKHGD